MAPLTLRVFYQYPSSVPVACLLSDPPSVWYNSILSRWEDGCQMRYLLLTMAVTYLAVWGTGCDNSSGSDSNGTKVACEGAELTLGTKCTAMYDEIVACCADKIIGTEQATEVVCELEADEIDCDITSLLAAGSACMFPMKRPECSVDGDDDDTSEPDHCYSHHEKKCHEGAPHWFDSCGELEEQVKTCEEGETCDDDYWDFCRCELTCTESSYQWGCSSTGVQEKKYDDYGNLVEITEVSGKRTLSCGIHYSGSGITICNDGWGAVCCTKLYIGYPCD